MDVAVLGLSIQDKSEIIDCMYEMEEPLLLSECVESVKIIESASVPLIKLKINLQKLTEREISDHMKILSIDIIFDDSGISEINEYWT